MKFRISMLIFSIIIISAGIYSCSKEDGKEPNPGKGDGVAATITANIADKVITKAHDGEWDENDAIGLVMLTHNGTEIVNDVFNYHYYNASSGGFEPREQNKTIYFPQDGSMVSFRAYYPYDAQLGTDMKIPVSVQNQTTLPIIDLMSADHVTGFSKKDPVVHLTFHHRLSKLIFKLNIQDGQPSFPLESLALTIRGMKTTGVYDLLNERLIINDNSIADISVPLRGTSAEREAIVMPRTAANGISFMFKNANGNEFIANLSDTMSFNSGYQYTFYINLKGTEASISAVVEPWIDGPAVNYDALEISTPADSSVNVNHGDRMNIYIEGNSGFGILDTFTYNQDGKWNPRMPVYWENISQNPARMRASMVKNPALNNTQMQEILVADEISVPRNTGANFTLKRAVTKAVVKLESNTFTAQQLADATITFPNYLMGGVEENGLFIPGQNRGDILIDRTDLENGIAIFQPQIISSRGIVATITINNRTYTAYAGDYGMPFNAGEASLLVININEEVVGISAKVIDWVDLPASYFDVFEVGTQPDASIGVNPGNQMNVYMQSNNDFNLLRTFTYSSQGRWFADPTLYWEDIPADPAVLRASIVAAPALNTSQLPDILIANQLNLPRNDAANFVLNHVASKVVVRLVSGTYTTNELTNAIIELPNYQTGGVENKGVFVPGMSTGDILVDRTDPENSTALIQPQTIAAGSAIIKITINGTDYMVNANSSGQQFNAGEATLIIVTVNKEGVGFSARVIDWVDEGPVNMTAVTVGTTISGSVGVLDGEQMSVYTDNGAGRPLFATYTYGLGANQWTTNDAAYWESLNDPTTFYASILRQAKYNATQLDDYLIATPVQVAASNGVNLTLSHPAAKIVVQLVSSDSSFNATELAQMNMVLPNYTTGATYNNGVFIPGTGVGDIIVATGVGTGGNSAIAIVQPQTIAANTTIISVTSPSTGRIYNATLTNPVTFKAGVSTVLRIDMKKTLGSMSANVVDWIDGDIISMVPVAIRVTGTLDNSSDFFRNKTVRVYKFGADFQSLAYTYLPGTTGYAWTGAPIYWDNQQSQQLSVTSIYYPYENLIPSVTSSTVSFPWNLPTVQSQGYAYYDLLTSHLTLTSPQYVNFVFNHPLSKVRVELSSNEFTSAELAGATVTLNGFLMNGSIIVGTGAASANGSPVSVVPNTDVDGSRYSALVMPQDIGTSGIVTITLKGYPNTPFTGTINTPLNFVAGKETVIKVNLKKTGIQMSAKLQDWTDGETGSIIIQ